MFNMAAASLSLPPSIRETIIPLPTEQCSAPVTTESRVCTDNVMT